MERVRLKRLATKSPPRRKKPFRYIPRDEQVRLREVRKRKRLGIRHDPPVAADHQFILALEGLVAWHRLADASAAVNNSHK